MPAVFYRVIHGCDEDRGASIIEYALLIVLIAIVAILAIQLAGNQVSQAFSELGSGLD